jgi:serine phosphatase RsbU (regulator of sigma subunit)
MPENAANKIITGFVALAGILASLIISVYYVREASSIPLWIKSGNSRNEIYLRPDSLYEFTKISAEDFVAPPIPQAGDIIVRINDSIATREIFRKYISSPKEVGSLTKIDFLHDADTLQTTMKWSERSATDIALIATIELLKCLISFSYIMVGLWAFFKRRDSGAVRALALFCFAMGGFVVPGVSVGMDEYAAFRIPYMDTIVSGLMPFSMFFGAYWLNLQLLFPSPRQFMRERPIISHLLIYLPMAAFLGLWLTNQGNRIMPLITIGLLSLQVFAGFIFLAQKHISTTDPIEKRQTRLVLWGSGIGLFSFLLLVLIAMIFNEWLRRAGDVYIISLLIFVFSALLLSPLSFAYSFGKYRLLEVEGKIRRGTRYLVITLILLVVFYGLIYLISEFLMNILGIAGRTPAVIVALFMALGFAPTQRRIQAWLERKIYPDRVRLRAMLSDFLRTSLIATDKKSFWTELEERLKEALRVDTAYPIIRAAGNGQLIHWTGSATPFNPEGDFIGKITQWGNRPVMRDELEASKKANLTAEERDWMNQNRIALILPMVVRSQLIGFLGIGSKTEQKDFEIADFEILQSLASQMAVAGENIMLLEESVEKRRLESELSLARRVQEGMLPQEIPDVPGISIAAKSRFCTEVAGDYYDVITVGDGRIVMAIGDVSGKGAGAALLMSNMQASFRTAVGIEMKAGLPKGRPSEEVSLASIVANINELICRNSQPEQFITFFVCVYDGRSKNLSYVNAGHNPPLVARKEEIVELGEGGLILGAMPGSIYGQETIQLSAGDMLLLYTDGASEAANAQGEMYGEDRIKLFIKEHREQSPQILLQSLEQDVINFAGDPKLTDDFTLLAAKILE